MFSHCVGAAILTTIATIGIAIPANAAPRCIQGYVWREAGPNDYVCVTPEMRARAAYDNSVALSRWTFGSYGSRTCIQGYVWREAFPGDYVCVTPDIRTLVAWDNAAAHSRWVARICASCRDGSCQCGESTADSLCFFHGGVAPGIGCTRID